MASATVLLFAFGLTAVSAISQNKPFVGIVDCSARNVTRMTVEECERECGIGWHPYEKFEVMGAVTTWSIPLFVLIGNMQFSNFDPGLIGFSTRIASVLLNYSFAAFHLLGNPI